MEYWILIIIVIVYSYDNLCGLATRPGYLSVYFDLPSSNVEPTCILTQGHVGKILLTAHNIFVCLCRNKYYYILYLRTF